MTTLQDLPIEIVDKIFVFVRAFHYKRSGQVHDYPGRLGLLNLCLTSRSLRQVARSHLYTKIDARNSHVIIRLARTLGENASLADLIKNIRIKLASNLPRDKLLIRQMAKRELCIPPLRNDKFTPPIDPDLVYSTKIYDFLLSSLRRLENLSIKTDENLRDWNPFGAIAMRLASNPESFIEAREIKVLEEVGSILPLLRVSNTERCRFKDCWEFDASFWLSEDMWLPKILELRFLNSRLTSSDMVSLVGWCPNLQVFHYQSKAHFFDARSNSADAFEIVNALKPVQQSLQTLIISLSQFDPSDQKHKPIQTLVDFENLECLGIYMQDLAYGRDYTFWHQLPKSLKYLHLLELKEAHFDELLRLPKIYETDFPVLEGLAVDTRPRKFAADFETARFKYMEGHYARYCDSEEVLARLMWLRRR